MRGRLFETAAAAKSGTSAAERRNAADAGALQHAPPTVDYHWAAGAAPDPGGQARALARASGAQLARVGGPLLQLQRDHGNRCVQQVVKHLHQAPRPAPISPPSLMAGPIEDRYERAAERVAQQVVGGASPRRAAGDTATGRVPPIPAAQREQGLAGGGAERQARQAIQAARGGGQPLPDQVRDSMEAVIGTDLSQVRLHTDARADQLAYLLQARAFTTGPEIFLRRGEYRPGSTAGQRLLAHELTHVAQQTGGTLSADGVSRLPLAAAGAGVIQRMKIGDFDTDVPEHLDNLKMKILEMETLSEVSAMRSAISEQLGRNEPDRNVGQLLRALNTRERRLTPEQPTSPVGQGRGALSAPPETKQPSPPPPIREQDAGRRTYERKEQHTGALKRGSKPAPPETEEPSPAPTRARQRSPGPALPVPPETQQPSPPPPIREQAPPRARKQEPGPASVPPELKPGGSGAEADVLTAGAALTKRSSDLLASATGLVKGPGDEPGAAETWVGATGTWLRNVREFLQEQETWYQGFKELPPDTRIQHRPTLANPLLALAGDLQAHRRDLEKRFEQEQKSAPLNAAIAKRKQEATARKELVGQYVGSLEFQLQAPPEKWEWGQPAQTVPAVLLEWIFTAVIAKVDQGKEGPSRWVAKLLKDLRALTTTSSHGLRMEVVGNTQSSGNVGGEARANSIRLNIDMSSLSSGDMQNALTGDDPRAARTREELVTTTASTLIHESAHVRQEQTYDNTSYPWKASPHYGGHSLGQGSSTGVAYDEWSEDVQKAFNEFEKGGSSGQAIADDAWKHIFPGLERYHDPEAGTDERAKELVSHLMELVYAWSDDTRFRDVFPDCAALLDRVITEGTPPVPRARAVQKAFEEFYRGGTSNQALTDDAYMRILPALELRYHRAGTDERAKELVSSLSDLRRAWNNDKRFRTVFPACTGLLAMADINLGW